jgi:hypothetical protein
VYVRSLESQNVIREPEQRGEHSYVRERVLWREIKMAIDKNHFGRLLRAARLLARPPLDSIDDLVERMDKLGFPISKRSIYAYERGDTWPPFDVAIGLIIALEPPGGLQFFASAFPDDLWIQLEPMLLSDE